MTVLHSGTTKKYSENWTQVFAQGKGKTAKGKGKSNSTAGGGKKSAKKKSAPVRARRKSK